MNRASVRQFFAQLRRRKVIRFSLAYAVIGWLIIEIASVTFPALLLPEWTVRLVIVLIVLGFVPAIVLAWVFDITPAGIERTDDALSLPAEAQAGDSPRAFPPQIEDAAASVAVLPFDNLSNAEDSDVLAEGIATEIHGKLFQLHRIRVAPRRSSFRFSDRSTPLGEVAQALNVRYVLSGSVLAAGNRIHVTAELDDAQQDVQLWSRQYERDLDDVLSLMSEIAEAVVAKFGGERLRSEISGALATPTDSLDAWSSVQKARAYILDYSADSFAHAEDALYRAIDLDSEYSAARAALGSILMEKVLNGFSVDPDSDSDNAIDMIETALTQSPNDPFVLKMSGMAWSLAGDPKRAIRSLRSSVEIAPYDFGAWGFLGWPLVATGIPEDLDELHGILDRILTMAPEHPGAAYWLHHQAAAHLCQEDLSAAQLSARQSIEKHRGLSWAWLTYASILGQLGSIADAREAALESARLNSRMTPIHYANRIRVMTTDDSTFLQRIAGLRAAELLDDA